MSVLVLIPLLLGVLQMGLLVVAKNTLNVATLGAARAGAASGGSHAAMNDALALGLAALHVAKVKQATGVGMTDISAGNYTQVAVGAIGASKVDNLVYTKIRVINPVRASFEDFGIDKAGDKLIPVTKVYDNMKVGAKSGQTHADALLLKIEVRYCAELVVPFISQIILGFNRDPACLSVGTPRIPMVSQALVRMTVPPSRNTLLK